jgi:hypothetical protein
MLQPPDRDTPPGPPRWVKVLGIIVLALVLAFVILHLLGGGFRGHAPAMEYWVLWPRR